MSYSYDRRASVGSIWELEAPEDIEGLERLWAGGIADLGEPRAAMAVKRVPGYRGYLKALQGTLRRQVGSRWTMYRAMTQDEFEAAEVQDLSSRPVSWTFKKQVAKAWSNLAMVGDRVVVQGKVSLDAVIMRGKQSEAEMVLYENEVMDHRLV